MSDKMEYKPDPESRDDDTRTTEKDAEQYYLIETEDGQLKCSCGLKLIKLDDEHYKCEGGYPMYSFESGEIRVDTFGRLMLRKKDHA